MQGNGQVETLVANDNYAGLLIDRLAAAIIDDSLPLKDVERELRGCVADVAVHRRGLDKRETASRCGVTEKSIDNYLKEVRANPKSPEREIARALQDQMLSLEEIHESVRPVLASVRQFTLDDAKRALEKLIRTGEVLEYPGRRYRAVDRPSIRYPATIEAHRELVDQKARDLDYVILRQKEAEEESIARRGQRFSRVVADTNLIRIDFTADVSEEDLPGFYEELSQKIAKLTMKYESKQTKTRVRVLVAMRTVLSALLLVCLLFFPTPATEGEDGGGSTSWELDGVVFRGKQDRDAARPSATDPGPAREEDGDANAAGAVDPDPQRSFVIRGDVDLNERLDLTDAINLAGFVTGRREALPCMLAGDANGDGRVGIPDVVWVVETVFAPRGGHDVRTFDLLGEPAALSCDAS